MEQLKEKDYTRQEIAELLEININDTKHFKRNVENKLTKWGYEFKYTSKKVSILYAPQDAFERLSEIMIRVYDLDVQVDTYGFACFMYYLNYCEDFQMMPWEERAKMLKKDFDVEVSSKTLERWAKKLIRNDLVSKNKYQKTTWMTLYVDGDKERLMVDGDEALEQDYKKYMARRKELVKEYTHEAHSLGMEDDREISTYAWGKTFKSLWEEFHCCFYSCSSLMLSAIGDEVEEIFELIDEIVEVAK